MYAITGLLVLLLATACGGDTTKQKTGDHNWDVSAREMMVSTQIVPRGISDSLLLAVMRRVPRHLFVPKDIQDLAYNDHPLPIGEDQTISQPYIVALMTDLLRLDHLDRVLEIGTGSGYQAAILAELVDTVYTIEIVEPLAMRAEQLLDSLGYTNVVVLCGDGYKGWPEHAPFDAIIVTCAPPEIPSPLVEQLAEGGRLVVPVGDYWQELVLLEKQDSRITKTEIAPVRFVPMTGKGVAEDRK